MHDQAAEIEQHPIAARFALAVLQARADPSQAFVDFVANRFDLARAESGADKKIIREGAEAFEIEQRDIRRLLFLRGLDGRANVLAESNPFLPSPVKGLLGNVFLDARRHKPVNGIVVDPSDSGLRWPKRGWRQCPARTRRCAASVMARGSSGACAAPRRAKSSGGITRRSAATLKPGRLATMKSHRPSSVS